MHEFGIAADMLEFVLRDALSRGISRITRIDLRIGELSGILPYALKEAFGILSEGTAAEGAELVIEQVPGQVRCRRCGGVFAPAASGWVCPQCGSCDVDLQSGLEMEIRSYHGRDTCDGKSGSGQGSPCREQEKGG